MTAPVLPAVRVPAGFKIILAATGRDGSYGNMRPMDTNDTRRIVIIEWKEVWTREVRHSVDIDAVRVWAGLDPDETPDTRTIRSFLEAGEEGEWRPGGQIGSLSRDRYSHSELTAVRAYPIQQIAEDLGLTSPPESGGQR